MTVRIQRGNWRIVNADNLGCGYCQTECGHEWMSPDCQYVCQWCRECLGCQRKLIHAALDDLFERIGKEDISLEELTVSEEIACVESPTGLHVCVEADEGEIE